MKKKDKYLILLRFESTVFTACINKIAFDSAYSTNTIKSLREVFITNRNFKIF